MEPIFMAFAAILSALMPFDMGPARQQPPHEAHVGKAPAVRTCQSSYSRSSHYEEVMGKVVAKNVRESGSPMKCGDVQDRGFDDLKASVLGTPGHRVERF